MGFNAGDGALGEVVVKVAAAAAAAAAADCDETSGAGVKLSEGTVITGGGGMGAAPADVPRAELGRDEGRDGGRFAEAAATVAEKAVAAARLGKGAGTRKVDTLGVTMLAAGRAGGGEGAVGKSVCASGSKGRDRVELLLVVDVDSLVTGNAKAAEGAATVAIGTGESNADTGGKLTAVETARDADVVSLPVTGKGDKATGGVRSRGACGKKALLTGGGGGLVKPNPLEPKMLVGPDDKDVRNGGPVAIGARAAPPVNDCASKAWAAGDGGTTAPLP